MSEAVDDIAKHREAGHSLRRKKPPTWIGECPLARDRDPLGILARAAEGRDERLVTRRNREMAQSAFSFLRGAAAIMSEDLASALDDTSGIRLDVCGDAHVANFGTYYSPERALVFDVNDFDEARAGPWEWDVCRLATSLVVAAREYLPDGKDRASDTAREAVSAYGHTLQRLADLPLIERCYVVEHVADGATDKTDAAPRFRPDLASLFGEVEIHTQQETVKKFIVDDGREPAFAENEAPPAPTHIAERVTAAYATYRTTLATGLARLLDGYSPACVGIRPVGEGSLGLRDYLVMVTGHSRDDALILQIKEATASALDSALGPTAAVHEGERVVTMQRTLQGVSDPLLGWTSVDGQAYYVRQFRDGKGAPNLEKLRGPELRQYARLCGETLARAHARSANPLEGGVGRVAGYIGARGDEREFIEAVMNFAAQYAKVTREDQKLLSREQDRSH